MAGHLLMLALIAAGLLWWRPSLRRSIARIRAHLALVRADALRAAIQCDDDEAVMRWMAHHDPLPADAWALAVGRAHPQIIRALLPVADPCAPLPRSTMSAVNVLGGLNAVAKADEGMEALRIVLADPRVSHEAVVRTVELWTTVWFPADAVGADVRLAVLLGHPALDVQALADNPARLARIHYVTSRIAAGHRTPLGYTIASHAATRLHARTVVAFVLMHKHERAWLDALIESVSAMPDD
jgi:hypothetical protein